MKNNISKWQFTFLVLFVLFAGMVTQTNVASAKADKKNDYKQGKVYTITPKSKPLKESGYGEGFKNYNSKTRQYLTILSYMEKFEKDGKGTLVFKKGTYTITHAVFVPSNVTIILEKGVKLVKGTSSGIAEFPASGSMFQCIRPSRAGKKNVYGKHKGEKNIHFVGKGNATINLNYKKKRIGIIMGHNKNVTVDGINFKNLNDGHFLEVDASQNVKITNCKFTNAKNGSDYVKEAINIDTPDKNTGGFNSAWSKHDKTGNDNVLIDNCEFSNLGRAIGTHKYSCKGNKQIYHTKIVITNNRINNSKYDSPIRVMNWKKSTIADNQFDTIKSKGDNRGMFVSGAVDVSIKNNLFVDMKKAFQCIAWKNSGAGSKYPITYNKFTKQNLKDMETNVGWRLSSGEYFIRINKKYKVYSNAQKIKIKNYEEEKNQQEETKTPEPVPAPVQ